MTHEDLRDKDLAVLQAIQNGANTVSEIKEETTLSNREINYSLTEKSLEQMNLVNINRTDTREWQQINGQERYIWKPKTVELTDKALHTLTEQDNNINQYEDMTKRELIERIHELEQRQNQLETVFKDFRQKVMERI